MDLASQRMDSVTSYFVSSQFAPAHWYGSLSGRRYEEVKKFYEYAILILVSKERRLESHPGPGLEERVQPAIELKLPEVRFSYCFKK